MDNTLRFKLKDHFQETTPSIFTFDKIVDVDEYWSLLSQRLMAIIMSSAGPDIQDSSIFSDVSFLIQEIKATIIDDLCECLIWVDANHTICISFGPRIKCSYFPTEDCLRIGIARDITACPAITYTPTTNSSLAIDRQQLFQTIVAYLKEYDVDIDIDSAKGAIEKLLRDRKYIVIIDIYCGSINLYRRNSKDTVFDDMTWEQGLRWIRNMMGQDNDTHDEVVKILLMKNPD